MSARLLGLIIMLHVSNAKPAAVSIFLLTQDMTGYSHCWLLVIMPSYATSCCLMYIYSTCPRCNDERWKPETKTERTKQFPRDRLVDDDFTSYKSQNVWCWQLQQNPPNTPKRNEQNSVVLVEKLAVSLLVEKLPAYEWDRRFWK